MPIYVYACSACGHESEVMQKMSDTPLTTCPQCKADTFKKKLTAAGFQLKGSGWYATDFKGGNKQGSASSEPASANNPPPCQGGTGSCACH